MIWTVIFALLLFSVIIFVHELGHFLFARLFKVKVEEFAIGMGPKIFSKTKNETLYSIRSIPIGGFCKMEGEDISADTEGSFSGKAWYKKLIILAAGAAMNILLGFIISTIFVAFSSHQTGIPSTTVDSVLETSPLYGFLAPGDQVTALNDTPVHIKRDVDFFMQQNGEKPFKITICRGGEILTKTFSPLKTTYSDGTAAYIIGFVPKTEKPNVLNVLYQSFWQTVWMGKLVFVSLGMLLGGQASVSDVSGPVGVVSAMNTQAQTGGLIALLYFAGFISVNIGIMNLLPIPALDGGRILFVLIEAFRRKPIPPEKEGLVHFAGLLLLMGIMVLATWNDIIRLLN